jgi:hypothetical protein
MPSDNGNRHVMDGDFLDNTDGNGMNIDVLDGCTPNQQSGFQYLALPPAMTMDYGFAGLSWSHAGAPLSVSNQLSQNEPNWNWGDQGHKGESPSYPLTTSPLLGNTSQQSHEPMPTMVNYTLYEVRSDSLAWFPEPGTTGGLPTLKPKPTLSSLGVITGRDSNVAISISPKKPGRRNGPLDAEGRKGASQMRIDRACVICKLRKTRVS